MSSEPPVSASDVSGTIAAAWELAERQKPKEGLKLLEDLINTDQTNLDAWMAAAFMLARFGELPQAEAIYRRVLTIDDHHRAARFALASTLIDQRALAEAEPHVSRILDNDPQSSESWGLLATLRQRQGRTIECADAMCRAYALSPNSAYLSYLLHTMQYAEAASPDNLLAAHREWDRLYGAPLAGATASARPALGARKLRIGFVSSDFGRHPTGFLILRALECLDKSRAFVACYYDRFPEDSHTLRFKAAADLWRVSAAWDNDRLAAQVQQDEIDVLFDLMGHTGLRLLTFAQKPAPIQITWAGYVGTTGLSAMDYLLADRFHVRPEEEQHYSEKVLRMPHDYVCYGGLPDDAPDVAALPALAAGRVTFGCFNNAAKLSSDILDAWAEILKRLPSSQLLLKTYGLDQSELRDRLHVHFAQHHISPQRVLLEGRSPHADLLAAYGRVDLALDTQPYSGGLTTCEALWMGVPVITFPGKTFAGRHSISHLSNSGLAQFIAADLNGYIDLAVEWANRLNELAALRADMREQIRRSPLCDAQQFADDFLALVESTLTRSVREGPHA